MSLREHHYVCQMADSFQNMKLKKAQKWSRFEHCSEWPQMVPNSHINWYFGPIPPKSWPKLENGPKWSRFEHCSNWPQMVPNGHIDWYFGPIQSKSWPKLENGQKWSWFEHCSEPKLIFWPNSAKKLTKIGKWPNVKSHQSLLKVSTNWIEVCLKCLQLVPNP